jgi:hypothetical protein
MASVPESIASPVFDNYGFAPTQLSLALNEYPVMLYRSKPLKVPHAGTYYIVTVVYNVSEYEIRKFLSPRFARFMLHSNYMKQSKTNPLEFRDMGGSLFNINPTQNQISLSRVRVDNNVYNNPRSVLNAFIEYDFDPMFKFIKKMPAVRSTRKTKSQSKSRTPKPRTPKSNTNIGIPHNFFNLNSEF